MDETKIIRNLRHMAWERAKGELRSMLHTYYWGGASGNYKEMNRMIDNFIKCVEEDGLHE